MALIEAYEEQYQTLVKEVNARLDRLRNLSASKAADPDAWESTAKAVKRDVEDADEVLAKFTMETRSVKGDLKATMQAKVKQYKIDLGVCKETIDSLTRKRTEASERADLFEGGTHGGGGGFRGELSVSNEHRSRLATATDRMATGSDRLKESRKIAQETEMVAVDIMEDLRQQRETLLHARDSANDIAENLAESRKFVKMIQRRVAQNKLFMYGVVVMVVVIIITLIFLQLSPSASPSATPVSESPPPAPAGSPAAGGTGKGDTEAKTGNRRSSISGVWKLESQQR